MAYEFATLGGSTSWPDGIKSLEHDTGEITITTPVIGPPISRPDPTT
jgi:hypothetical protein